MSSQAARRAFKKLLRAEEQAFAGDLTTLRAAKVRTREAFRAPLASSTQEDEKAAVSHAHAVVSFLRQNLAQARRLPSKGKPGTSDDRYRMYSWKGRGEGGHARQAVF